MKVVFLSIVVAVASAARLENTYLPPNSAKTAGGSGSFLGAPFGGPSFPKAPSQGIPSGLYNAPASYAAHPGPEAGAQIKSLNNNNDGTSYQYSYETSNNINVQEHGQARVPGPEGNAVAAQGSFQYVSPDGQQIQLTYTADENGFQPQGAHLPTPPPIPEAILKSIQQNAAEAAHGGQGGYPSGGQGGYPSGGAAFPASGNKPSFTPQGGYHY